MRDSFFPNKNNPGFLHSLHDRRLFWSIARSLLELDRYKHKRKGKKSISHWTLFEHLVFIFGRLLKIFNLYEKGFQNARNIIVRKQMIKFSGLPELFHEYTILHLTDLHLDCINGIEDLIIKKIEPLQYDLCVITGDYLLETRGGFKQILKPMSKIADAINAKDGIIATLGNHDTYLMVEYLEGMNIRVLTNESIAISRKQQKIIITGVDDPHYFFTDQAIHCLEEEYTGYKIALVHTPELYDVAAQNNYSLYLCGHTHGGQICLPGGIPVVTHLYNAKKFYRGQWSYGDMKGYTSEGCGVVGIPIRFNSRSEIAIIRLECG